MAPMLADPIVSQFPIFAIQEPFHNSYTNSTHNPSYTSSHLFHPNVDNSGCIFLFINLLIQARVLGTFQTLIMAIGDSRAWFQELEILLFIISIGLRALAHLSPTFLKSLIFLTSSLQLPTPLMHFRCFITRSLTLLLSTFY
jgi:hypothetical protein